MQPELTEVLAIQALKDQAAALYDELDARIAKLKDEYGAGRFDYELVDAETPYLKFEIIDNAQVLAEGGTVWKSTAFKPLSFEVRGLKTKPASLK